MNILIWGDSPDALAMAAIGKTAGHRTILLTSTGRSENLRASGFSVLTADGKSLESRDIPIVGTLEEGMGLSFGFDLIALFNRSYLTTKIARQIGEIYPVNPLVVACQRTAGNEDILMNAFGADRVACGLFLDRLSFSAAPISVTMTGKRMALSGSETTIALVKVLVSTLMDEVIILPDCKNLRWSQLLFDMIGKASAALLDLPLETVLGDEDLFDLEVSILKEALSVLSLYGIKMEDLPGFPAKTLVRKLKGLRKKQLRKFLVENIRVSDAASPSLVSQLHEGSGRTEVAWMHGAVALLADNKKRLAPINHSIALTISDIAAGRVYWDTFRKDKAALLAALRIASSRPGLG